MSEIIRSVGIQVYLLYISLIVFRQLQSGKAEKVALCSTCLIWKLFRKEWCIQHTSKPVDPFTLSLEKPLFVPDRHHCGFPTLLLGAERFVAIPHRRHSAATLWALMFMEDGTVSCWAECSLGEGDWRGNSRACSTSWLLAYAMGLGPTRGLVSTGMSHPLPDDIGNTFVIVFWGLNRR